MPPRPPRRSKRAQDTPPKSLKEVLQEGPKRAKSLIRLLCLKGVGICFKTAFRQPKTAQEAPQLQNPSNT
eukprot:4357317-Pyramimonas_sp.AAC.1